MPKMFRFARRSRQNGNRKMIVFPPKKIGRLQNKYYSKTISLIHHCLIKFRPESFVGEFYILLEPFTFVFDKIDSFDNI